MRHHCAISETGFCECSPGGIVDEDEWVFTMLKSLETTVLLQDEPDRMIRRAGPKHTRLSQCCHSKGLELMAVIHPAGSGPFRAQHSQRV